MTTSISGDIASSFQISRTRTCSPRSRNRRAMFEPTKPDPPVTRCRAISPPYTQTAVIDGYRRASAAFDVLVERGTPGFGAGDATQERIHFPDLCTDQEAVPEALQKVIDQPFDPIK